MRGTCSDSHCWEVPGFRPALPPDLGLPELQPAIGFSLCPGWGASELGCQDPGASSCRSGTRRIWNQPGQLRGTPLHGGEEAEEE